MATYLLKTEPETYSFDDLERDGRTGWDGVRNALAQRHLRAIAPDDELFIYHSGKERQIVGVAKALTGPIPDETDATGKSIKVDLAPVRRLDRPVTLAQVKAAGWDQFDLVRMSRLSVMPVPDDVRSWILAQA
ncbi:EVE domain-containing protein [bacterium]|nr:EVE domain-containing protein [bacterium]